jgi:hypothetical protein
LTTPAAVKKYVRSPVISRSGAPGVSVTG